MTESRQPHKIDPEVTPDVDDVEGHSRIPKAMEEPPSPGSSDDAEGQVKKN